jgi:alpha-L-rhamnosidase
MPLRTKLHVSYLRCEYKVDPIGIDTNHPRLGWVLESHSSKERNQIQTAYQILVSSSQENLEKNISDFWDSGKIISEQQNQIDYAGKKLRSNIECWWKVKVWDEHIIDSDWSKPSRWTMGLLNKSDWKASWVRSGIKEKITPGSIEFSANKDSWIWFPLIETKNGKGIGKYYFSKSFKINDLNKILSAQILITADEYFKFYLNKKFIGKSDDKIFSWTRPKLLNLLPQIIKGKNSIGVEASNSYLEKPGLAAKLLIEYKNGRKKIISADIDWKCTDSGSKNWLEEKSDDGKWINASVTAKMGEMPWRIPKKDLVLPPSVYLRKEFHLKKNIKKAFVFVSALGLYKAFVNGVSISDDRLMPGWTDYNKRVYYNSYDLSGNLKKGKNCLGIILADGWYAGYIGWEKRREYYGKNPHVILQLELTFEDGTREIICTDKSWSAMQGPLLEADLLMGETYDAKKELPGWCEAGIKNSTAGRAAVSKINIELNSYPGIPIRKTKELLPIKISEPKKGIFIFDLGLNIAGCVRLKIDGRKTDKIILRFGEMLDEGGNLYTENIRMARAADTYFTKGEAVEIWEPSFTYHGFRYVEVSNYPENPPSDLITGIVFHADLPVTGTFQCSNKKLNKLFENIFWSQRANFMDIPTDCPQRDERLGWAADAVDFVRTASFNMETSAFYTKWLTDLNDAQETNGAYPAIAPKPELGVGPLYSGAAGFADAGIITPYYLYKFYNDVSILKKCYKNMQLFLDYLESNKFTRPGPGYGDWLSVNADTPQELIDAAFFAFDAKLMVEISLLINKKDEADHYKKLYEKVKKYFNENFVSKDGSIKSGTQTSYVLPLYFELLDEKIEKKSFNFLIADLEKRNRHISTGFIGLTYLFPVLTKFGRSDIVYKLLLNESFPSWLNMINNGATTMWERWDSWTPENGFFDPLMNSFNHTSLGVIGEWFYTGIGGINSEGPGFKKIIIKPQIGGNLTFAKTAYDSINGKIISDWKIKNEELILKVTIPINTSAKIFIPLMKNGKVSASGEKISIKILKKFKGYALAEVGSGDYKFKSI